MVPRTTRVGKLRTSGRIVLLGFSALWLGSCFATVGWGNGESFEARLGYGILEVNWGRDRILDIHVHGVNMYEYPTGFRGGWSRSLCFEPMLLPIAQFSERYK